MKTILRIFQALALSAVMAPAVAADSFRISPIGDHIFLVKGPVGNTLVAADTDGLILFDGVPAEYANEYLDLVRQETGVDTIKTLILSHWHPEVAGLNSILGPMGVEIIAHDNTRQWLGTTIRERGEKILHTPDPFDTLPNKTFYWGELNVPFRDDSIQIGYLLQSHTDGDIYAWIRNADVLYTGPVIRSDAWATVDETTNGFIGGITDAYATLDGIIDEDTVIVPASGDLMDKAAFDEQSALYTDLKADMVTMLRQSLGPEEVLAANPAKGLKPQWGSADKFLDEGFRSFYGHLRDGRQIGGGFP